MFYKTKAREVFAEESFSQEGEDCILTRVFGELSSGYFVDVGAHHPQRFSNTYRFYKRGWRGINIDATPGSMKAFNLERSRDVNLEVPISDTEENLTFYIFNEPALNTFNEVVARDRNQLDQYKIIKEVSIKTMRLETVLAKHLPADQRINFLTIDAEGFDYRVLKSNDWKKFRPELLLFEGDPYYNRFVGSDCFRFVEEQEYEFIAKTVGTYFFKDLHS